MEEHPHSYAASGIDFSTAMPHGADDAGLEALNNQSSPGLSESWFGRASAQLPARPSAPETFDRRSSDHVFDDELADGWFR
jgi:hypothetical protein